MRNLTILHERPPHGDDGGWEYTGGDMSVGIFGGWLHFCEDGQTREAPELIGGGSIHRELDPLRRTETFLGAEVLRCGCGATLLYVEHVEDPYFPDDDA